MLTLVDNLSEPSLLLTRKKLQFVTVNPQNLKRVRVHLIEFRSQCMPLAPHKQIPLLLGFPGETQEKENA
jgi:hypothetical protein